MIKKEKKLKLYNLLLATSLILTGCGAKDSSKTDNTEPKIEYEYTAVGIVNGNAILYDCSSVAPYADGIYSLDLMNGQEARVSSATFSIFESHEEAEQYACAILGDKGNIICMDYPEHKQTLKRTLTK